MAGARKQLAVVGAAVVLPTKDGSERTLFRNAPVDPEAYTAEGIKHAVKLVLVAEVTAKTEPDSDAGRGPSFTQADIDAAVKAAEDAKDAELADARKAVEEKAEEVAEAIKTLEAAKAEAEKPSTPAPKAPAPKQS
ncbi:hypothetical protein [Microbacterium sp. NPDC058389]|uniref:hypothetical protein n=1 Tax=Microbacterium sp. NPDC058389 TaxID=3346475 RepID=UPI0036480F90